MSDKKGAREDIQKINEILDRRGGYSEEDEGKAVSLEIKLLIEEKQYRVAKERLSVSYVLPGRVRFVLSKTLARAISFEQVGVDSRTREWAQNFLKKA
jgi:hypothetical protein